MGISNAWEYLDNYWVLAGLVLVLFTGLLKLLPVKRLTNLAIERLMHKGINYLFILCVLIIALGLVLNNNQEPSTVKPDLERAGTKQKIDNNNGIAANALGDVNLDSSPSTTQDQVHLKHSDLIDQQIKNNSGVAINAGGDVSMDIPEE